jgi:predicted RNase H-like nuclease
VPQRVWNAGVDGARGEWVVALTDGRSLVLHSAPTVSAVLDLTAHCAAVGVDMPLHMPEKDYRPCELEAKALLGPARSSIFHTPVRAVLDTDSYIDACAVSRAVTGKAISKQSWYLLPSIRAWIAADVDRSRIVEVHPETTFRVVGDGVTASKKTAQGAGQRLKALSAFLPAAALVDAMATVPAGPAMDDVLDAIAAAWSAARYAAGVARILGGELVV